MFQIGSFKSETHSFQNIPNGNLIVPVSSSTSGTPGCGDGNVKPKKKKKKPKKGVNPTTPFLSNGSHADQNSDTSNNWRGQSSVANQNNKHNGTYIPRTHYNNRQKQTFDHGSTKRQGSNTNFIPRQVELRMEKLPPQREMPELSPKQLRVGSLNEGKVTSINKTTLMIQFDEDVETLDIISEQLSGYLTEHKVKINRPRPGFLAAVCIDGRWLRVQVIGYYEMKLVDIGKICTYADQSGNYSHDLFYIDYWKELKMWPMLSTNVSIETLSGGARKFLNKYQQDELEKKLVDKPFIFKILASTDASPFSVQLIPMAPMNTADLLKHELVTTIPELDVLTNGEMTVSNLSKLKDGIFCGQVENAFPIINELSRMCDMYKEEKGLEIDALKMERGQFVIWKTQLKGQDRFRRVVVTGESDDGRYYEGLLVDCGDVLKLRLSDSFVMIKPLDKYPCQCVRLKFSGDQSELRGKRTNLKVRINSKDENGVLDVSLFEIIGACSEDIPASVKVEHVEEDWDYEPVKKPNADQQVPVVDQRSFSAASSSNCKLSTIFEASIESFAVHELECSQESLPSLQEDDFEPSFYEMDQKCSYPNDQLEFLGNEIAEMVDQQDVRNALDSVIQKVVQSVQTMNTNDSLIDLEELNSDVLVDVGNGPPITLDLMDFDLDESPRSRTNSNIDILTGCDNHESENLDSSVTVNSNGDLIDC